MIPTRSLGLPHAMWLLLAGPALAQDLVVIESTNHPAQSGYYFGTVGGGEDYTGDGVKDFIVCESTYSGGQGSVVLYSGATNAPAAVLVPESPASVGMWQADALPDLTGDGRGEFALRSGSLQTAFVHSGASPYGVLFSITSVPAAETFPIRPIPDTGGDGIPELVVANKVVLSGADGSFAFEIPVPLGYSLQDVADMDNDGDTDFIFSNAYQDVGVFGSSGAIRIVDSSGAILREIFDPAPVTSGYFGWDALTIPDSTGDGIPEIVVGSGAIPIRPARVLNGGNGMLLASLGPFDQVVAALSLPYLHRAADCDGDGQPDFYVADNRGYNGGSGVLPYDLLPRLRLYSGADYGHLRTLMPLSSPRAGFFASSFCTLDDTDGDGVEDLLVGCPTSNPSPSTGQVIRFQTTSSALETEPAAVHFGRRKLGHGPSIPLDVAIQTNLSTASGTLLGATITGPDASAFDLGAALALPRVVEPGTPAIIPVRFTPSRAGLHEATLQLTTDHAGSPTIDVPLAGIGDPMASGNSILWAFGREPSTGPNSPPPRLFRMNTNTEGISSLVLGALTSDDAPYARGIRVIGPETIALCAVGYFSTADGGEVSHIHEVNIQTGATVRITSQGSAPPLNGTRGFAVGTNGSYYVNDRDSGQESIVRVVRATGTQSVVSGAGIGSGPPLETVLDMLIDDSGDLLVATTLGLYRVTLATGQRSVIGSSAAPDISGMWPAGPGQIFASRAYAQDVVLISTQDGSETVVSSNSVGNGPPLIAPSGMAVDADGSLFVYDPGYRGIMRINRPSGDRELLSSGFVNPSAPQPASGFHLWIEPDDEPTPQEIALKCTLLALQAAPPPSATANWDAYE